MTVEVRPLAFEDVRKALQGNFKRLSTQKLYYVEIDRDKIWETYLSGFSEETKQEHNCNSCKSFLRQFGGIVAIEDNKMVSIWDGIEIAEAESLIRLSEYIHSLPITDVFLSETQKAGTEKNLDMKRDVTWRHFFLELPKEVKKSTKDIAPLLGEARDNRNVFKRGLDELTVEATETVLELIGQDSLYRGKEFEALLKQFVLLQRQYKRLPVDEQDNYCWVQSREQGGALNRIRNTAIGTLLIDLSAGLDLDSAVTKYEKVMAPHNYKRPTALVTPAMIEKAKATLSELGLLTALNRRYANEADLRVCDLLFKFKPQAVTDVFDQMAKETTVNPKTLSKIEEISIDDFIKNVVPTARTIEVLLENNQLNKFVSLLTAQDPEAAHLFKWNNPFSWSYTGAVTDSIAERVKQAGGRVDGELRTSLSWSNFDDLDIHVFEPNGDRIYFHNKRSYQTGAQLDVDMNAGLTHSRTPVENIIWPLKDKMLEGNYTVQVNNYCQRETKDSGFSVQIECQGQTYDFEYRTNPRDRETQLIAEFIYTKAAGLQFKGEVRSNVVSKTKWGVTTNQWRNVTRFMLSPNHWNGASGNRHYLFMLDGCVSDEAPRPFFNEFLKEDLDKHRKVLEVVGGRMQVEESQNQLSGLGFSETLRASIVVRVLGKFQRILRVNI